MQEEKDEENTIVPEDLDDSVILEENQAEALVKLKLKLKEAEAKAKEYLDGWQRSQADFVNLRKRDEEAKIEFLKFANVDLILQLMPVLDSLSLAEGHAEPIYKQLVQILKSNGLEELNPMGETFNPKEHEAVSVIPTDKSEEDHKILEVMQKGYILAGKIIRPAKVKIGEFNK